MMRTVLHLLPHPGGGAEAYIDVLEGVEGYRHDRLPLSGTRSRARGAAEVISGWPRLTRRVRDADLVHVHGDTTAIVVSPLLGGRPSVFTPQGLHRLRRVRGVRSLAARRGLRRVIGAAARTACSARAERDDLAAILPPDLHARLVVVPNGIALPPDPDPAWRRTARQGLGLGEDQLAALFVGRLEARKDPFTAIAATETARARGAPLVLLIAGTGPLDSRIADHSSEAIRPLGHRDDVAALYAAADVFVAPSQREGMSFALLEAMSHGLVPVVSDGPGNAEAVGDSGVVFPVGDADGLSARLLELAAQPAARHRLGDAARERVRAEHSAERFRERIGALYEAVERERARE
jgi:glycosyltransferase involved in cell wall biosynthesis